MAPEDKQKIKDAFNRAVNKMGPAADEPVEGMVDDKGRNLTRRELVKSMTDSEDFYQNVDSMLSQNGKTVDQFVKIIEKGGFSLKRTK